MPDCVPLTAADLDAVLPHLLATPDRLRATPEQVRGFHEYLADGGLGWQGWYSGPLDAPRGVCVALLLPGRTTIVMVPSPDLGSIEPAIQTNVLRAGLAQLAPQALHYAQALVEPGETARRDLLAGAGFTYLAPLIYLERATVYPWAEPPPATAATWRAYGPQEHARFADVVLATYADSQDCPELTGLRPIDDILAAHRATGHHDPQLWELALVDGEPAGCLLLAALADNQLLEVVYMGVVPAFRRRGVGALLLQRALAHARRRGARRLTVVVDGRNAPARRLYARFALAPLAQRDAWLYRWEPARPVHKPSANGAQPVDNV
jgi:ribosomal protein S18 acetylase RimI-like enzyme